MKQKKHLDSCCVWHTTFGGGCFNCGLGLDKIKPVPTKAERIEYLKALGFKFPN